MNRIIGPSGHRAIGLVLVLLCAFTVAAQERQKEWEQIPKPPLPEFRPQQPKRIVLDNGMVLFLQPDHELPFVNGTARIRGGSREEPAEKAGLISIYGQAWRTGGTVKRTGDELDEFLEARAASVETGGGAESTSIGFSALKEDFEPVFAVFLELLREPAFREDKIGLAKRQINTAIARRNDDIGQIAARESTKLGYGPDHPYARVPEYATVGAVNRDDLAAWHQRTVHPNNIIFGISGDFDTTQMEARLRKAFAAWQKGPAAKPAALEFRDPEPGVYFVAKDDVNQSAIRMVHLGIRRDHPDFYAVEVLNEAFGGGMSSRLFLKLRSELGLAYSVGGGVGAGFDRPGLLRLSMGTRSDATGESIAALLEEIRGLQTRPITEVELRRAKDGILNSFVFNFDSKAKVLRELMTYEFYGYPLDTLERYRAGIERVTVAAVNRAARQHIHPDRLAILVVGKAADFDRDLASFGPVKTLDITIPEAAPAAAAAGATTPQALALMRKVVQHFGGAEKVAGVRAVRFRQSEMRRTPQGEVAVSGEGVVVYPDRTRVVHRLPMGEITVVVSPAGGFMQMGPAGTQPMPASFHRDLLQNLKRELLYVVQNVGHPQFTFQLAGTEKIGEVQAQVVEINAAGAPARWFVDPESGRLLRSYYVASGMAGPTPQTTDYSDWRQVDGISFPFRVEVSRDGQPAGWTQFEELQLNPEVDPALFEPPAEQGSEP